MRVVPAEGDLFAVVEDVVDLDWGKEGAGVVVEEEVGAAAGLGVGDVTLHYLDLGMGQALNLGHAGDVVVVGLAVEEDFGIGEAESESLDVLADLGRRGSQIAVDEDVALRRGDEVRGEIVAADVVQVAGDPEGSVVGGPLRVDRSGERSGGGEEQNEQASEHGARIAGFLCERV